jgi:hypothetical protein
MEVARIEWGRTCRNKQASLCAYEAYKGILFIHKDLFFAHKDADLFLQVLLHFILATSI